MKSGLGDTVKYNWLGVHFKMKSGLGDTVRYNWLGEH